MAKRLLSNKIKPYLLIIFLSAVILLFVFFWGSFIALGQIDIDTHDITNILNRLLIPPEIKNVAGILTGIENKEPIIGIPVEEQEQEALLDIPDSFFEKGRTKFWLTIDYKPEDTEIISVPNQYEISCIRLKAWQVHTDESGARWVMPGAYRDWIYIDDLSNPAIYDGANLATNLLETETKKFINWNEGKMTICLWSIHYRYASQKVAKIKISSKDNRTNLYQKPEILEIQQWVDYSAIVQRKDAEGNWRYRLVRKKNGEPYPGFCKLFPDDCEREGDIIICEGGADWFKAAIVHALNKDNEIFGKAHKINISYEESPYGWTGETSLVDGSITFYIAQPEMTAKILRLNLKEPKDIYNYQHEFYRSAIIWHEASHAYQWWALKNKEMSGIKDEDDDNLPADTPNAGAPFGWQIDDPQINGFNGDVKSVWTVFGNSYDPASYRRQAITRSVAVMPNPEHNWAYFKKLILDNLPKEPIVGRGKVPNGWVGSGVVIVTFYWDKNNTLSDRQKELLKGIASGYNGENFVTDQIITSSEYDPNLKLSIGPIVNLLEIKYRIITPDHPREYDANETARGVYVGK